MKKLRRDIPGADIVFAAEWTNGNSIFVKRRKIIAETTVHVSDAVKSRWQQTGKERYKRSS